MVNLEGPEGKNILGSFTENEIESFFSKFVKWNLLYKNVDVKSLLKIDDDKEENRGFDFIYELYEPFESGNHGIIIESKKIDNPTLFNKSRLSKDIDSLKQKIQNASKSKELRDDEKIKKNNIHYFKYGILCYRFHEFDLDKYQKVLKEYKIIETKKGNNFPTIFILTNDRLSAFINLKRDYVQNLTLKYYYPYYNVNQWMKLDERLSLFYLFSDIIPFELDDKKYAISFDKPSLKSLELVENFCGRYNHNIFEVLLAKGDYRQKSLYEQYKVEWEKRAEKEINLNCLDSNMNLSLDISGVFTK
ncbi:hypothetical protein FTO70_10665 [Methanosarcina sp. KYL-1]|uniref:hypothetical protein n=1 Tax=Methanosarcina sp. KYL-1 TaxID=2602068 RepID=UPI0021015CD5|nr:hypothetical protein [Methanosarcina sp. KYL-1]MCQ1536133.1 hypothetical protein [Methanosarcina sp. KYL-1]